MVVAVICRPLLSWRQLRTTWCCSLRTGLQKYATYVYKYTRQIIQMYLWCAICNVVIFFINAIICSYSRSPSYLGITFQFSLLLSLNYMWNLFWLSLHWSTSNLCQVTQPTLQLRPDIVNKVFRRAFWSWDSAHPSSYLLTRCWEETKFVQQIHKNLRKICNFV